ncbi:MAG: hypothetical protein R6W67_12360 [Bacteroidales bacterium]
MKRITLIVVTIAIATILQAQKVALHTSSGIQFFTGTSAFVQAYTASTHGDTIYLPGGGFSTPSSISKQLRIYGAGHYPDSTLATGKTFLIGTIQLQEDADGCYFEGVEITSSVTLYNNHSVNNVTFIRCRINGNFDINGNMTNPSTNVNLFNNVIVGSLSFINGQNIGVFNNIIQGRLLNSYGNVIKNNIFLYTYTGYASYYVLSGDNNDLYNNIFWGSDSRYISGFSNKLFNNIFVNTNPGLGTNPQGSGNYYPVPQADILVNHTGTAFDYDYNYHLQNPASYPGSDDEEIGIYGGFYPYKEGAVPSNPHFILKTIASKTDENGQLTVEIKAGAQKK